MRKLLLVIIVLAIGVGAFLVSDRRGVVSTISMPDSVSLSLVSRDR